VVTVNADAGTLPLNLNSSNVELPQCGLNRARNVAHLVHVFSHSLYKKHLHKQPVQRTNIARETQRSIEIHPSVLLYVGEGRSKVKSILFTIIESISECALATFTLNFHGVSFSTWRYCIEIKDH
jgi:hypothetical protein